MITGPMLRLATATTSVTAEISANAVPTTAGS